MFPLLYSTMAILENSSMISPALWVVQGQGFVNVVNAHKQLTQILREHNIAVKSYNPQQIIHKVRSKSPASKKNINHNPCPWQLEKKNWGYELWMEKIMDFPSHEG